MTDRQRAAERAAVIINEAEQAMDDALARASILLTELPALQRKAGLNAALAQPTVVSVCAALSGMTEARASLIAAHRNLSAVQRKLGVIVADTPLNDKEGKASGVTVEDGLRLVA